MLLSETLFATNLPLRLKRYLGKSTTTSSRWIVSIWSMLITSTEQKSRPMRTVIPGYGRSPVFEPEIRWSKRFRHSYTAKKTSPHHNRKCELNIASVYLQCAIFCFYDFFKQKNKPSKNSNVLRTLILTGFRVCWAFSKFYGFKSSFPDSRFFMILFYSPHRRIKPYSTISTRTIIFVDFS